MKNFRMLASGVAGAAALTAVHQAVKENVPDAPRMDVLGMRSIEKICEKFGIEAPQGSALFSSALVGDIISNSIYYSPVGMSKGTAAFGKGISLGLMAGLGALKLPQMMGLGSEPATKTPRTMALTVGMYVVGGLAAAAIASILPDRD
jgi:hypothetical protein